MDPQAELDFDARSGMDADTRSIYALLRPGRAWAISSAVLSRATGFPDTSIRKIIRNLVMHHGILVGSITQDPPGFYIAETQEEIMDAARPLRSRALKILKRAAVLQRASLRMVFDQAVLEDQTDNGDGEKKGQ